MQSFPQVPLSAGDNTGHFAQKFNTLCELHNNGIHWLRWQNLSLKQAKETILFEFPQGAMVYFPESMLLHLPQGLGLSNPADKVLFSLGFNGNKEEVLARHPITDTNQVQRIALRTEPLIIENRALVLKIHQAQEQAANMNLYLPYFLLN